MTKINKITLIGSGNLAWHLGKAFFNSGIKINGVYSRKLVNAEKLAIELQTFGVNKMEELPYDSDLYVFAVTDDALEELSLELHEFCGYKVKVVHTSGFVSSDIFKDRFSDFGVFYFLQTFTKHRDVNFDQIPCFITTDDAGLETNLYNLASKITGNIEFISDEKRKVLHLAAVFANNFTNYLYSVSKHILESSDLKFDFLYPLISETAMKITDGYDPDEVQTGPAKRTDLKTIEEQMRFLERFPEFRDIYQKISEDIIGRKFNDG